MDWYGSKKAPGFEYHLLAIALALIALALVVIVNGAVASSVARFWYQHQSALASTIQEEQGRPYETSYSRSCESRIYWPR